MSKIILTDTCFWLGLVDPRDQYHEMSNTIADVIEGHQIVFPWPCLYETISTHLTRRREQLLYLEKLIKKPEITLLDDTEYKDNALEEVFNSNRLGFTYSLTDSVIREILKDINVRVDYLVTYNNRDFEDICQKRQIEILLN